MACGVDNNLARLALKAGTGNAVDFATGATGLRFTTESVKSTGAIVASESITGSRDLDAAETRRGPYSVGGSVNFDASVRDILVWGEYALGANSSGVLTPANTLPVFALMADKVSNISRFGDCKVNRLTISNDGAGFVRGVVEIVGRSHTGSGLSFPTLTLGSDETYEPLVFSDLVIELDETEYAINSYQLVIDNQLQTNQRNALYADCLREGQRIITLNVNLPSTSSTHTAFDEPDLSGVSAEMVFTHPDAAVGVTIELPALQKPRDGQTVQNRNEQRWDLSFRAVTDRANSVTTPLTITCDTTE
ncbi:phage tail tube protein [Botrimarina mediterranea]|uniref:phage tail tube protein n=1 Tax=Botrimarina mediterranea TaxID=2528022 RepID=UPI001187B72F|nr:hypothetical protein K2D_16910 [Planctomycetes bacterium K2D]